MSSARRRLPFGAELLDDERTRFRLWAPDAREVDLILDGDRVSSMTARSGGWFELTSAAPAGTRYRYRINGAHEVPDPAARAQEGGVDGPSIVVDATRYAWQQPLWRGRAWHEAIICELHCGLYGGFAGVTAQLADLAQTGYTAIELMPVAQFAGARNWGYDGVLPFAPAASYGTPDELKALVDSAHALGMTVLLDVVYNHFGPHGNHLGRYARGFFDASRQTPWGAAIDFERPEVREFFIENALYWLHEFRFDGLRIDAVHAIDDNDFMRTLIDRVVEQRDGVCVRHILLENDDNNPDLLTHPCAAQLNDDAHHVLHVLLTGERAGYYAAYADAPGAALVRWLGEGFVFQGEPPGYGNGAPRGVASAHLAPTSFVNALQNHDQIGNRAFGDRLAATVDHRALLVGHALILLIPQIPLFFMGEDWASAVPFLYFTDFTGELADAVRIGRRREFARFESFAAEDIPDPNAVATFKASRPDFEARDNAYRASIRELMSLRKQWIVPRGRNVISAGTVPLGARGADARWRMDDGAILRVAVNLGPEPTPLERPQEPPFYESAPGVDGTLPAWSCAAWLTVDNG